MSKDLGIGLGLFTLVIAALVIGFIAGVNVSTEPCDEKTAVTYLGDIDPVALQGYVEFLEDRLRKCENQ